MMLFLPCDVMTRNPFWAKAQPNFVLISVLHLKVEAI